MNLGKLPSIPNVPAAPVNPAAPPTRVGTDVGSGPAQGNVGIGLPQHLDPNKPAVGVDATIHNPTGIGGDIHVQKDVPIPTHIPDVKLPSFGSDDTDPVSKSKSGGGGFGLPDMPSIGLPDMPDISLPDMPSIGLPDMPSIGLPDIPSLSLPDMPSMPDISLPSFGGSGGGGGGGGGGGFGLPDMPSIGLPDMPSFGMPDLPSFGLPGLPSMGMPDIGLPGMPGFRFPDLPKFELPDLDLSDWGLSMPDLIPDWGGDSEEERQEPHKRAKHQDKLTVEICLETEEGIRIPGISFTVHGKDNFKKTGQLDNEGKAEVEIPKGKYKVEYHDYETIKFRELAATINSGILKKDIDEIYHALIISKPCISNVAKYYSLFHQRGDSDDMFTAILKCPSDPFQKTEFARLINEIKASGNTQ